ncbi:diaminopimelate decarboxylase [Prevotella communis]|uniref:Diaminopimelate decarboxylase n=1 Tax=Prevotella communis TaxID=2913614 RepID=A0A1G8ATB4_9BACT|nr:hypothetical protein [Prevotella communis]SDH24094.1 diaminopimelate decarboxylase [Prevotella communis]
MLKTPYFILDLQKLEKNLSGLRSAFTSLWPNFAIGYSFKTNNLPWIASWMHAQGVMAEVVSSPEYELAKYVGYEDNCVILNGPCKGFETMDKVLKAGGIVNLDSFQEINHIKANIQNYGSRIKVGLRINFDLETACPGETIPGKEPGRFGFNIENRDFDRAIDELKSIAGVEIVGIHAHHSTKTKSLGIFKAITKKTCECASKCSCLEYIDLGGCLFGDKPGAPTFEEYAQTIVSVLCDFSIPSEIKLLLEPGAALIASPVSYVCKVIGTKDIKGTRLVFTDGSIKHIAPQMNAIRFGYNLKTSSKNTLPRQVISGYSCIEMDRFLDLNNQPELQIDDEITIKNVGAYTISLAPLFIEYYPSVIVKNGDKYSIAREAWTTKEFTQKQKLYV